MHIILDLQLVWREIQARASNCLQGQTLAVYHSNILIDRYILSTPGLVSIYDVICHNPDDVCKSRNLLMTRLHIMQCNCLHNHNVIDIHVETDMSYLR